MEAFLVLFSIKEKNLETLSHTHPLATREELLSGKCPIEWSFYEKNTVISERYKW